MATPSLSDATTLRRFASPLLLVTALLIGLLSLTVGYFVWRQHNDQLAHGEALAAMHARLAEDQLTQSLQLLELALGSLAPRVAAESTAEKQSAILRSALANMPMLRSLNVLSPQGQIVASSNPANVGRRPEPSDLAPTMATAGDDFRIAIPWAGRDFADGEGVPAMESGRSERRIRQEFLPVLYSRDAAAGTEITLVAAVNPDFFLNQFLLNLEDTQGVLRVFRYDNRLLFSTLENDEGLIGQRLPGALFVSRLRDSESGVGMQRLEDGRQTQAAFRASHRYPVLVMAHVPEEMLLAGWGAETQRLLLVGGPAFLGLLVLAGLLQREQLRRRREKAAAIERERHRLATVLDSLPASVALLDRQGKVLFGNPAWQASTPCHTPDGDDDAETAPPCLPFEAACQGQKCQQRQCQLPAATQKLRADGQPFDLELSLGAAPNVRWVRILGNPIPPLQEDDAAQGGAVVMQMDITEQKGFAEQLRLYTRIFEYNAEGIAIANAQNEIVWVNRAFQEITGYSEHDVLGRNPSLLSSGTHDPSFYAQMWRDLEQRGYWQGEIANRRKNGDLLPGWLTISAIENDAGELTHYVAIFSDITDRKASEARIRFLSEHDFLTGLPNRGLFADRLSQAINRAARHGARLAVLDIDLDRFKAINDSLGHSVGDQLLQEVAQRVAACVRSSDTVCRQGGDEFLILLDEVGDTDAAARVAVHLVQAISRPYVIDGHPLIVTPSIGIAMYPDDGTTVEGLVSCADMAMYYSKGRGRNAFHFFKPEMTAQATERLAIECGLRGALDKEEFSLLYQPQVDLASGAIIGVEALIRWNDPQRGLRSPNEFIALAEETGLIVPIGDWVLHEACRQARQWRDLGLAPITVAVNVAAPQFYRPGFIQTVGDTLAAYGLPGSAIELEVTERLILETRNEQLELLEQLRRLGVQLSIDDFGSGYSSLAYLHRLPIDKLKIDRSFICDLGTHSGDATITETIIHLAHDLGLTVLAEGVETEAQRDFLQSRGCDSFQGFLFSEPVSAEAVTQLLQAERRAPASGQTAA